MVTTAAALYTILLLVAARLAVHVARRERRGRSAVCDGTGVAIATAILSGDPRLEQVLISNLDALPRAQFLWLVDSDDAEARRLVGELALRRRERRITVIECGPPGAGVNPKLVKLAAARHAIVEPILLVLDDDTTMPPDTLGTLVAALEPHGPATLATSLPGYEVAGGPWSRLLSQFVANNAAITYLAPLVATAPVTLNGMAYALRVDRLDRLGGFEPLCGWLTDDVAVAGIVRSSGGQIFQSSHPHWVRTTVRGAGHYAALMHRWMVFALLLLPRLARPLRLAILAYGALRTSLLLVVLIGAATDPSLRNLLIVAALVSLRSLILVALQMRIHGRSLHAPFASIVSELLEPLHVLHAFAHRRIAWRTRCLEARSADAFEVAS